MSCPPIEAFSKVEDRRGLLDKVKAEVLVKAAAATRAILPHDDLLLYCWIDGGVIVLFFCFVFFRCWEKRSDLLIFVGRDWFNRVLL